jgi:intracellular multiplication protein IcmT
MDGFSENAHWRDSARVTRFFLIDSSASFPLLFFLVHIAWWTFICALIATIFFSAIARFGFTVPVFFRWLRLMIAGPRKIAAPPWKS